MTSHIAQIENNLFLGSCYSVDIETLKKFNITYIFHCGFPISSSLLNDDYFLNICKHEYFEFEDNSQSVHKMLEFGDYIIDKIDKLIDTETILVCCVAGKSRSASMIALYLHHKYPELSYEDIINYRIKKVRSISINQTFADAIRIKINRHQS
jgi:hypothetical protein